MYKSFLLTSFFCFASFHFSSQNNFNYPVVEKDRISDDYFGYKVEDPYRWLEDDRSARTAYWVNQENLATEKFLNRIYFRQKIKTRLTELWNYNKETAPVKKGEAFFCFKNNGLQNQYVLYIKKTIDDPGKILLDPNLLSNDGTVSLSGISISKNGKTLAYSISKSGSDWVEIHFKDIVTMKDLPDVIKWVKFSEMSWKGSGIYYGAYNKPTGSELSQKNEYHKVYFHQLGNAQEKDILIFEDKKNPNYSFETHITDDENYLFISISQSTYGNKLLVKNLTIPNAKFIPIADNFECQNIIIDNVDKTFYLLTNQNAPKYKLVSFTIQESKPSTWKTIIAESSNLLEGVRLCNNKIVANYLHDACSKLTCYDLQGKLEKDIVLPGICKLNSFNSNKKYNFATYSIAQFIGPDKTYYLDASNWSSKQIFKPDCKFQSDNFITKQVFYSSKDGTKIPMFITYKKDIEINEKTPCFIYGYGGFNISLSPEFKIDRVIFLESGGIYCVPNIRGGGEYGEDWHSAGTKCNKQNVFDDFIAACEFLVANKYTSYQKIAIHGRSNGGLLIGAVMTQRPDICKVALPAVGVLDMLRFHLFTIGMGWSADYGCSLQSKEEFFCLLNYSPLHNVKSIKYPATLILTGDHDDRVVPAHSFKFAATLQEKNTGNDPILIRIDPNAGHGAGKPTTKQIDELTDMWSFVFYNLDMYH